VEEAGFGVRPGGKCFVSPYEEAQGESGCINQRLLLLAHIHFVTLYYQLNKLNMSLLLSKYLLTTRDDPRNLNHVHNTTTSSSTATLVHLTLYALVTA
jgi:hypothetical protein